MLTIWGVQSAGCKDFASKVMASWLPVSAFVTLGFEHSVANMFFIPLGIHFGAEVTWGDLVVKNLIPAIALPIQSPWSLCFDHVPKIQALQLQSLM